MPTEHLMDSDRLDETAQSLWLLDEKPIIRILLYTDHPRVITPGQDLTNLGTMIDHLHAHAPTFGRLCIKWLSRNSSDADNKLNREMLKQYDQIWFFGIHQLSGENFISESLRGGPESELNANEVHALQDWMKVEEHGGLKGGGVLMTGDHAENRPTHLKLTQNNLCPDGSDKEMFLGLGRALGRCVPRAGLLRKWEGKPTKCKADSFNTQSLVPGIDPDGAQLQVDDIPMQLILSTFGEKGSETPGGVPHPLFWYKAGGWIQVFPDHMHEGAVIIPRQLDQKVWPKSKSIQPKPRVIARGVDHRNCRLLNILAAYNGDSAGVGRIVADSTWHHYLNENLTEFAPPASEGSVADQIGQFYGNLAVWLSPRSKRREMAYSMFYWLANHLFMLEESRLPKDDCDQTEFDQILDIGRAANSLLSQVAAPCEVNELLQAVVPDQYCEQFESLYFPERGFSLSLFPSKEVILGCIVDSHQQEILRIESSENLNQQLDMAGLTTAGFESAFDQHVRRITQAAHDAQAACNSTLR